MGTPSDRDLSSSSSASFTSSPSVSSSPSTPSTSSSPSPLPTPSPSGASAPSSDAQGTTTSDQLEITPEEFQLFVEEGEEQLQDIEDLLLSLEAGQSNPDGINRLFRAAHTLKGNSATVGFHQMASLTHALESLFDQARKGQLLLQGNKEIIDLLLRTLDTLRGLLDTGVRQGGQEVPDPAVAQLELELKAATTSAPAPTANASTLTATTSTSTPALAAETPTSGSTDDVSSAAKPKTAQLSPTQTFGPGTASSTGAAETAPAGMAAPSGPAQTPDSANDSGAGRADWKLRVQLRPDCGLPAVRIYQLFTRAVEWGQVLATDPTADTVEQLIAGNDNDDRDAVWRQQPVHVWLRTSLPPERLQQAVQEIPEIASIQVEPGTAPPATSANQAGLAGSTRPGAMGVLSAATSGTTPSAAGVSDIAPSQPRAPSSSGSDSRSAAAVEASTIRVNVRWLDLLMNLVGELVIDRNRLLLLSSQQEHEHKQENGQGHWNHANAAGDDEISQLAAHLSRLTGDLQDAVMQLRMVPIDSLFRKLPRVVRETARLLGKKIRLEITGNDTQLDRSLIEELHDPVLHLLRNAVDHGIEDEATRLAAGKPAEGLVHVGAYHREGHFYLEVSDDGGGISPEKIRQVAVARGDLSPDAAQQWSDADLLRLLFRPGFSTRTKVTEVSGRGVGLDVVGRAVEHLGGTVDVHSEEGKGTTFRIRLPLTLAIVRALLVSVCGVVCAIPLNSVTEAVEPEASALQMVNGRPVLRHRDDILPLFALHGLWETTPPAEHQVRSSLYQVPTVIVQIGDEQLALQVDALLGEEEVVVKPFGKFLGQIPGLAGTTLLGDGRVALILDVPGLFAEVRTNASYLTV